jgi:5-methyltetrahydrofolate--homocysteine methyltransferase
MDRLVQPDERPHLIQTTIEDARRAINRPSRDSFTAPVEATDVEGKTVREVDPPTPPFWGVRELADFTLTDIWPHLDLKTLFRLHWGGKGVKDEAWEKLQNEEFLPRLQSMQKEAEATGWLKPRVRYAYFPANSDGNDLIIFDPDDHNRELGRFPFPRQPRRERLCLADYFLPLSSVRRDVATFQIVTVGADATARTERLQADGEYSESFFSHGLSVQTAEGLAEYTHQRLRADLGIGPDQGKRYSWGYPACPDLSQHTLVSRLLDAPAIGIRVTEGYQFDPEQTTAALVVSHPDAKYYALARSGGEE